MIVCQNCKSQEPEGTIFCSECGAQFLKKNPDMIKELHPHSQELIIDQTSHENVPQFFSEVWCSLQFLDTGEVLSFSERSEYTLGRLSDNQPIEPDIDLSPFGASDNGVSRLHAVIKHIQNNILLVDLGSSNGTFVNGVRILPNIELPLHHGDILALGKLKMQINLL